MQIPQDMLCTQIYLQVTPPIPQTSIMQHWIQSQNETDTYIAHT